MNPTDPFHVAQDYGEGMIAYGTREWTNYRVAVPRLTVRLGAPAGLAVRVQGLNRYYALVFVKSNRVALVKAWDDKRTELASAAFDWMLDVSYEVAVTVEGSIIKGFVTGGPSLEAADDSYTEGGIGLIVTDGAVSANQFNISPLK